MSEALSTRAHHGSATGSATPNQNAPRVSNGHLGPLALTATNLATLNAQHEAHLTPLAMHRWLSDAEDRLIQARAADASEELLVNDDLAAEIEAIIKAASPNEEPH